MSRAGNINTTVHTVRKRAKKLSYIEMKVVICHVKVVMLLEKLANGCESIVSINI